MIEFDWDTANIGHIAEHGVTTDEAEFALNHRVVEIDYHDWHEDEKRFAEVGMTREGRILFIVTTIRGLRLRVVTAYNAPRHLVKEYLELG